MDDEDSRFTGMYRQMHPRVLAYTRRRIAVDQAAEVTDETFLIAWRKRETLPEDMLPWLLTTARHLIGDQVRKNGRQDALAAELARCAEMGADAGAEAVVVERMTVLKALTRLREQDREALMLTVWDGLSSRQAAAVLGCSPVSFTVRLHRARQRLTAAFDDLDSEGNHLCDTDPRGRGLSQRLSGRAGSLISTGVVKRRSRTSE